MHILLSYSSLHRRIVSNSLSCRLSHRYLLTSMHSFSHSSYFNSNINQVLFSFISDQDVIFQLLFTIVLRDHFFIQLLSIPMIFIFRCKHLLDCILLLEAVELALVIINRFYGLVLVLLDVAFALLFA
jgi:hypothetical protein